MLRNMRVLVDNFHAVGHTCPGVCFCKAHPALEDVNTSRAESVNSVISVFKRSVRTMGVDRAMTLLTAILSAVGRRAAHNAKHEKHQSKLEAYELLKAALKDAPPASS